MQLTPIPAWAHLNQQQIHSQLLDLLDVIQREYRDLIERVPPDWKKRILRRDPHPRPQRTKRSTRPLCHAASREEWIRFKERFREYCRTYLRASDLLRRGVVEALELFPPGCHLPRLTEQIREAWESPG